MVGDEFWVGKHAARGRQVNGDVWKPAFADCLNCIFEGCDLVLCVSEIGGIFDVGEMGIDTGEFQVGSAFESGEKFFGFMRKNALSAQKRIYLKVDADRGFEFFGSGFDEGQTRGVIDGYFGLESYSFGDIVFGDVAEYKSSFAGDFSETEKFFNIIELERINVRFYDCGDFVLTVTIGIAFDHGNKLGFGV